MRTIHWSLLAAVVVLGVVVPAQAQPAQSPIGLPAPNNIPYTFLSSIDYQYPHNQAAELDVKNEGSGDADAKEKSMKILIPNTSTAKIKFDGDATEYKLKNIHFHRHSEHEQNGQFFPMEMHMVHQSDGGVNVAVGRWIVQGDDDFAPLSEIFSNFPAPAPGDPHPVYKTKKVLNIAALVPEADKRGTYRYKGSLTTPHTGSFEFVNWVMFNEPLKLSAPQIAAFSAFFPNNFRPVQPIFEELHELQANVPEPGTALLLTAVGLIAVSRTRRR
jgi:carbonic anhydrase